VGSLPYLPIDTKNPEEDLKRGADTKKNASVLQSEGGGPAGGEGCGKVKVTDHQLQGLGKQGQG